MEEIGTLHDYWQIIVCLLIVVALVFSLIYCNRPGGFCSVKWFFSFAGTVIYDRVKGNPVAAAFMWSILRGVDLIPL